MTSATGRRRLRLEWVAPAGAAVLTWLVIVIQVAYAASFGPLTITGLFEAAVVAALAWPVFKLAPWRAGLHDRLRWWLRMHWQMYVLAGCIVGLAGVLIMQDGPAILLGILAFPVESVDLFRLAAFVRAQAGAGAATAVLFLARLLLQALWALLLAAVITALSRALVRR
ncbi:MAG: hypothetical protein ABEH64_11230 [Salinirussus sp.]